MVDQLIEYQKYKKLGDIIAKEGEEAEMVLERKRNQIVLPFNDDDLWEEVAVWDLLKVFSHLISSISEERILDMYEQVTVNEKLTLINEFMDQRDEFLFSELIRDGQSAMEIICSLLAVLELIKGRMVVVMQNRMFGDIRICKRDPSGLQ